MAPETDTGPELDEELCCHGWVTHSRTYPVKHAFRYRVWMLLVDVDLSAQPRPVASRWPQWLVSWDRGHLLGREEVTRALRDSGIDVQPARIFALTQPHSAGFSFNPVNFYFCYDEGACQAILSDVRNTPWNEKHCYVLDARGQHGEYAFRPRKRLHVSPFLPMQGDYRWRFRLDARRIEVTMRFDPHGRPAFMADLSLSTAPLTRRAVMLALLRSPAQNLSTLIRIYRQAARLYLRRTPFHPHPRDR